jgi:hypothetical protein
MNIRKIIQRSIRSSKGGVNAAGNETQEGSGG